VSSGHSLYQSVFLIGLSTTSFRLSVGGSMLARSGGQGRGTECNVPAMGCMIKLSVNVADWNVAIIMLDARSL